MAKEYRMFRVLGNGPQENTDEINKLLAQGWTPIRECPGHASGNYQTWLVTLEREKSVEPEKPQKEPTLIETLQGVIDKLRWDDVEGGELLEAEPVEDVVLAEHEFLEQLRKM